QRLPNPPSDDRPLPDLCFGFYDRMVVFDHLFKTVIAIAQAHIEKTDLRATYQATCDRVDRLVERLQEGVAGLQLTHINPLDPSVGQAEHGPVSYVSDCARAACQAASLMCMEYANAGDICQVALTQRLP